MLEKMSNGRVLKRCAAALIVLVCAAVSQAEDTLIVLNKSAASAWLLDPQTGEARAQLRVGDGPHEAAVSPDGKIAVVANYGIRGKNGNSLTVIDIPSRKVTATIDLDFTGHR